MVRQTKRFKKGLNKKVLSAILAASMIMTSSSFAFASTTDEAASENTAVSQDVNGVLTEDAEDLGDDADVTESTEEAVPATLSLTTPDADPSVQANATENETPDANKDLTILLDGEKPTKFSCTYNGEEQKPSVTVQVKGKKDTFIDKDLYTVSYSNNTNASSDEKAKVVVTFTSGNYSTQSIEAEFTISPASITDADVKWEDVDAFVYDGKAHYPKVLSATVELEGVDQPYTLTEDDYDVYNCGDNHLSAEKYAIAARTNYQVQIEGKGNFTGAATEKSQFFNVDQADLGKAADKGDVTVTVDPVVYDNGLTYNTVKDSVQIVENATEKALDSSAYAIQVKDEEGKWTGTWNETLPQSAMSIGTHELKIYIPDSASNGNYEKGSYIETTYEVVASSLATAVKDAEVTGFTNGKAPYNGTNKFPTDLENALRNTGLEYGLDYVITNTKEDWINAGEYTLNLEGQNKYAGQTATVTVKITPRQLPKASVTQGTHHSGNLGSVIVTIDDTIKTEDGTANKYVILEEGKDYTFEVTKEATKSSNGKVEITGIGNYTTEDGDDDVQEVSFELSKKLPLSDPSISVEYLGDYAYDGDKIVMNPEDFKVTEKDGNNTYVLKPTEDYAFEGTSNIYVEEAGEVIVTLKGANNYEGTRDVKVNIEGVSFADNCEIEPIDDILLDELKQDQKVTVTDIIDDVKVVYKSTGGAYKEALNIEVYNADGEKLANNFDLAENPGTYTVVVSPKTDKYYTGSLETTFNVIGHDLKKAGAVVADIEDQVYTSEAITPAVTVKVGDKTLVAGEDYEVTYTDNVKGGEATAIITGINNYSGTLEKNFNITRAAQGITMTNPLQERDLGNGSRTSTSKVCTLKLATTMADEDTKFTYTTSDPSVATVNDGKITYRGVGECTITVSAAATDSCEAASLPIKVVVGHPGTPTFTPSVTKNTGKKAFVVTSSTVRGADGFEVQYSIRDDFWKATTKDFSNTGDKLLRQTCKTVHSNMTYYIRVRAYQTVDGEKVYSTSWSPVKTIKTK